MGFFWHPVRSSFVFLQISSLGEVLSSEIWEPKKKNVVSLYRSARDTEDVPVAVCKRAVHGARVV